VRFAEAVGALQALGGAGDESALQLLKMPDAGHDVVAYVSYAPSAFWHSQVAIIVAAHVAGAVIAVRSLCAGLARHPRW
jgi:hypothetical protein